MRIVFAAARIVVFVVTGSIILWATLNLQWLQKGLFAHNTKGVALLIDPGIKYLVT